MATPIERVIETIRRYADGRVKQDDPNFDLYGWCGGNFDDAYTMGVDDGEVMLAQSLAAILDGVEETVKVAGDPGKI